MLVNHQDTELSITNDQANLLLDDEELSESDLTRIASSNQTGNRTNKRGRKRIHRESKIQMILNNLPTGVTYIGPEGGLTEENVMAYAKNPSQFSLSISNWEDECLFERP